MKTILQWNINGFYTHYEQLQIILKQHIPDILCLQETNFKKDHHPSIKRYNTFAKNRENENYASGGVAIAVSDKYNASEIPLTTNLEAIAITTCLPKKINICNVYIPNSHKLELEELSNLIAQIPKPQIIAGDFNSHHHLWGSLKTDKRGKAIEKLLTDPNLILLNTKTPTHFNISNGSLSSIDLTICNTRIAQHMKWKVLENLHDSDHFPIKITYEDGTPSPQTQYTRKWNTNKMDWPQYKKHIINYFTNKEVDPDINPKEINEAINIMETLINHAADEASETSGNHKPRKRTVPWWNEECKISLKESHHAFNRAKKSPTTNNLIEFKKLRAKFRRTIKASKKKSWMEYTSSITNQTPTKEVWKKIKQIDSNRTSVGIQFLELENGKIVTNPTDVANSLAEKFQMNSSNHNYHPSFPINKTDHDHTQKNILQRDETNMDPTINAEISIEEIQNTLQSTKDSAPGPDNIPNSLLKQLPKPGLNHLLKIFNCIWIHKVFPDNWRKAIVVPIPKPNKNKHKPESYRPIALTNTMCKLLEKIINRRLRWFLETNNLLSPNQYGFRQFHSTTDVLTNIETNICDAFQKKENLIAVCLDIEKAYDMIWKPNITNSLIKLNINGHMLAFITNFLTNRSIQVRINGILSNHTEIQNGVPQGSVLSVTLFLIGINDITKGLKAPVKAHLFADDLTLTCSGKNPTAITNHLQTSINHLQKWSEKSGLKFAPEKTQAIMFTRKQIHQPPPKLLLNNTNIKYVNNIKLLGLILDSKLTWTPHIKYLKESCTKRLNIIKVLANKNWGADQETLIKTYKSIIRSKIEYGSIIYSSAKPHILKIIEPIHNSALKIATGVHHTCPTSGILLEAKEMNLEHRRKLLCTKYALKISATPQNPTFNHIFNSRYKELYKNKPKLPAPLYIRVNKILQQSLIDVQPTMERRYEKTPYWMYKTPKINLNLADQTKNHISRQEHKSKFLELNNSYPTYKKIYTDASKLDVGVGYAIIMENQTIKKHLPQPTSIFSAEAYAILEALKHTATEKTQDLIIYTDSMSVAKALTAPQKKNKHEIIQEIQENYTELTNNNKNITITWIPSHQGITGNEQADTAAKEAANPTFTPGKSSDAIPYQDLFNHIKKSIKEEWTKSWNTTKRSYIHSLIQNFYQPLQDQTLNRKEKAIMSRLRTGHTKITHDHILNNEEAPKCTCCNNTPLTTHHILYECTKYEQHRRRNNIKPTTALTSPEHAKKTIEFIKETGLYHKI